MKVVSVVLCVFLVAFVIGAGAAAVETQSSKTAAEARSAAEAVVKADREAEQAMNDVASKTAEEAKAAAKVKTAADEKAAAEEKLALEAKLAADEKIRLDRKAERLMQANAVKAAADAQNPGHKHSEGDSTNSADDRQAEIARVQAHMMKQVMSGMNTLRDHADEQLLALNTKRNKIRVLLSEKIEALKGIEKAYDDAFAAHRTADRECTAAKSTAASQTAFLNTAIATYDRRNPIVEKELALIRQLVDKVGILKSINENQLNAGQQAARDAAFAQSKDMVKSLQSLGKGAEPLTQMVELVREHAEYTKPILDLLSQLKAKLLSELTSLTSEIDSAKVAVAKSQSKAESSCKAADATKVKE
jgi:hypothetical protein